MNATLIKIIQSQFFDKKLNPNFSTFLSKFTSPKELYPIFSLYSPDIGNVNKLIHNLSVPMTPMGNKFQKQSSICVLRKRCSRNTQEICRITLLPKCDFKAKL